MSDDDDYWDPDAGSDDRDGSGGGGGGGGKDQDDAHFLDDGDDNDRARLHAFYEEASMNKMADAPASFHNYEQEDEEGPLSQQSANLSLAEMSRLDETFLSQTSHHEEEEERQRKKLERRARRKEGIKAKKPRRPPTEIQLKRHREYKRFKYEKGTDLSQEQDVGGSMEYLMRSKLGEKAEQRRLRAEAKEKVQAKRSMDYEEMHSLDDAKEDGKDEDNSLEVTKKAGDEATNNDGGPNWNFMDEGYVTMPRADAEKLPYYVYRNSKRRRSSLQESDMMSMSSKASTNGGVSEGQKKRKRRKPGHLMPLEQTTTASGASRYKKIKGTKKDKTKVTFSPDEPDNVARSFPLHFQQLKKRMDLHAMVDMTTLGSERMIHAHGRNAKQLWTRMVAGGVMISDQDAAQTMTKDDSAIKAKSGDDDSISNVSSSSASSSKSSEHSYQPPGMFSQMSFNTSVIGMDNNSVDDANNVAAEGTKQNPLFRLMSMVHTLPKTTHRQQLLLKIAQELGTNRRLWEEELKYWVEGANDEGEGNAILTSTERWALKSFLGVDGSISSPPSWASDPSMPTHPTVIKQRLHSLRSSLLKRLRLRIKSHQKEGGASSAIKGFEGALEEKAVLELGSDPNAKAQDGNEEDDEHKESDMNEFPDDTESNVVMTNEESFAQSKTDESINDNHEPSESIEEELMTKEEGEQGGLNSVAAVDESAKLLVSLMDEIQRQTEPEGGVDKYAKIIHESSIDTSNIDIALASFMDHLTASKARLREKQLLDSSDFQHRQSLSRAQGDVSHWHEYIVSYLKLAETLSKPKDANFYKSGNAFPESAPLAQAVMATQSYFANGGGVGCGRKKKTFLQQVKEEGHSSDSESSDQEKYGLDDTNISSSMSSMNNLEKKELRGIQLAAKELAKRGKDCLADPHLASFAPIHLTTGIAMIAEILTPDASELLSRPCCPDSPENRTPFDLMNNMVTMIEDSGSLISPPQSSWHSKGKIIDGMLVTVMHDAAIVFRKCIEKDPENVDHWSWYVATLLGMLCIAHGSSLSNSTKAQNHDMKAKEEQTERPQLECFGDIRKKASIALTDFVSQSHNCPMFHFAISSMLEWKRAIFLMHSPNTDTGFGLEVKRLHAYHIYQWATKVWSGISIAKVKQLCESNLLPIDALFDVLAHSIERNPCERNNWAQLCNALGAADKIDNGSECLHTKSVEPEERSRWWGKHRAIEWEDQFFCAPKSAAKAVKPEFIRIVTASVDSIDLSNRGGNIQYIATKSFEGKSVSVPDPIECLRWIWNPLEDSVDLDYDPDTFIGEFLPENNPPVASDAQNELGVDLELQERLSNNPNCEALCMKIVVACHLLGVWHPFVCDSIWWLAMKLWQSAQRTEIVERDDYGHGLAWLSMHGLNIAGYLKCRLNHSLNASTQ